MSREVTVVVEGTTDAVVARRLLEEAGFKPGAEYVKRGKPALDEKLPGYNNAARFSCWLVLRDLDRDGACAPELRTRLLPHPSPHMRLHIPVRAIEAWLMADSKQLSRFLSVPQARVAADPESLPDPKRALVDLARQSRRKTVQEALAPAPGTTARVGPGYAAYLIEFATERWRPDVAAERSRSLARLRVFLRTVSQARDGSC
jgi:hypothetical protein